MLLLRSRAHRAIPLLSVLTGLASLSGDVHADPKKPATAASAPARMIDAPCKGCRAVLPPVNAAATPIPLLVVLHGDWGVGPAELLSAWEAHALRRGVAVLALQCPRDLGCKNSFWQWNGDPSWVTAQVDALAAIASTTKRPIDRERLWIAGWSGGATYIGMHVQTFQRTFAAVVYQGGGIAPFDGACATQPSAAASSSPTANNTANNNVNVPAFFLTGTGNPLHSHVARLREHHESCHDEVVWKVLPGADHPAEWKALESSGGTIVEWLLQKRRPIVKITDKS